MLNNIFFIQLNVNQILFKVLKWYLFLQILKLELLAFMFSWAVEFTRNLYTV